MSTPTKPNLKDAAKRNPGITPARVRQMQEVVKQLQDRGVLQQSKYDLQAPLSGPRVGTTATHHIQTMNRTTNEG